MAAPNPNPDFWNIAAGDLTRDQDLTFEELLALLDLAAEMKKNPAQFARALSGRYLALLFEKPSLRTRMTFELAIKQLGGDAIVSTGLIAEREPIKDVARNLERWTNGIVARTFMQRTVDELAKWAGRIKASGAKRAWVYFNNDYEAHAPANARTMREVVPVAGTMDRRS